MNLKNNLSNQINSKVGMAPQQVQQARSQALSGLSNVSNPFSVETFH